MVETSMPGILKAALLISLIGGSSTALAQASDGEAASALKSNCRNDYRAHCMGSNPAPPIEAACLAQFYINLSKTCQVALDAYNAPANAGSEP